MMKSNNITKQKYGKSPEGVSNVSMYLSKCLYSVCSWNGVLQVAQFDNK